MNFHLKLFIFFCFVSFAAKAQKTRAKEPDTIVKTIYTTYYAKKFEGRKTTNGERYRAAKLTAAHKKLPFGTIVKVTNLRNGKTIEVRINDRGPFSKKFELDLSQSAAKTLGIYRLGYAKVEIAYVLKE
jgi:rare lipoprotein A